MHAFTYILYIIAWHAIAISTYVVTCMYVKTDMHEYNIICIMYILIYTAIAIVYFFPFSVATGPI